MAKRKTWRCFHCDTVFLSVDHAREHFGPSLLSFPACQIKAHESHLITYIRKLETKLDAYRQEDNDILRSIWTLEAEHRRALQQAEEQGYNKGVQDMQKESTT